MKLLRDTWLIFQRSISLTIHTPAWLFIGLMQPILYLVLFGPLLKAISSAPGFPGGGSWNVFVPGLLVQIALFSGGFVGFALVAQLRYGVIERFRVTPISRTAVLLGMSLRDVVVLVGQALILIALAIPFGLSVDPYGLAVTIAILVALGLTLAPTSYVIALQLRSEDAFAQFINSIAIPMLLLSGILLPMSLAPAWLGTLAAADPLLHAVEAIRAVFTGRPADPAVPLGLALFAVLAVVALLGARRAFSRAVA